MMHVDAATGVMRGVLLGDFFAQLLRNSADLPRRRAAFAHVANHGPQRVCGPAGVDRGVPARALRSVAKEVATKGAPVAQFGPPIDVAVVGDRTRTGPTMYDARDGVTSNGTAR